MNRNDFNNDSLEWFAVFLFIWMVLVVTLYVLDLHTLFGINFSDLLRSSSIHK